MPRYRAAALAWTPAAAAAAAAAAAGLLALALLALHVVVLHELDTRDPDCAAPLLPPASAAPLAVYTDYTPTLPAHVLERGIVSYGDPARTRRLAQKLAAGGPLAYAALGGSITSGQGAAAPGDAYPHRFARWLAAAFPAANVSLNLRGAIPATPSSFAALCLDELVRDADLVTVEFNVNDGAGAADDPLRLAHERLLRRLLALPSAPAVVEVLVYRWVGAVEWG
jgi:hypothetical protein